MPSLRLLLALLLALTAGCGEVLAADADSGKHILLLYSYGRPGKGVQVFDEALATVLNAGGIKESDLYFEHLDLGRSEDKDYVTRLRHFLLQKYQQRHVDLIITVQQPARNFLLREAQLLAPEAPLITVQAPVPSNEEAGKRRVLADLPRFDIKGTLEAALQLFPDTRHLLLIAGESEGDRRVAAEAAAIAAPWQSKLAIDYGGNETLAQLLERVAKLPPQSVILFLQYNRDAGGRTLLSYEAEAQIAAVANAPVFGLYDFNLRNGGIGGSVSSVRTLGERTGKLALQVLSGQFDFARQVTPIEQPFQRIFDWQQIQRWGGDASRLGGEVQFINRSLSFWQRYGDYVSMVALVIIAQFTTIAALLLSRRRRRRAEKAVEESEAVLSAAIADAPHLIMLHAEDGQVLKISGKWLEITGYTREQLATTRSWLDLAYGPGNDKIAWGIKKLYSISEAQRGGEFEIRTRSGEIRIWDFMNAPLPPLADGRRVVMSMAQDITESQQNDRTRAALLAEKEAIFQNAVVGIALLRHREIVTCNSRMEELFGYPGGALIGQRTRMFWPSDDDYESFGERAYEILGRGLSHSEELIMRRADGSTFWASVTGRALDPSRPHDGSIWIYNDINERKIAEEKVQFLAYHDALTGLPNRLLVQDRFSQAMAFADRSKTKLALLFLDLDHFKTINDSLGHAVGDALLKQVAQRLAECVRETDTISRQGGDEFLVLLPELADAEATAPVLVKMLERLQEPFYADGNELATSVSIGIALYPDDGHDFENLQKKADTAMYRAKDAGGNIYRFFDEQMNIEAVEHLSLRNGLRRALDHGELVLHYQPQINLHSGKVVGCEALIRWRHPELGMMAPGRFIPIAEESRLIIPIGEWVLQEACRQAVQWRREGLPPLTVAVNLSAVQFKRGDLEQTVISALESSGHDPAALELELTESILIGNTSGVLATVTRLKSLGVTISIDDFGTGYSSLSYLKRFAVDKLKIDQSFVRDLATDPEDAAIVLAIIQMAKSLGLITIAEGVEDEGMLKRLRLYQCDEAQGYLFARPMPAEDFAAFVRARQL